MFLLRAETRETRRICPVGARLKSLFEEQAKQRQQAAGGDRGNQYTGGKVAVVENLPPLPENGKSRDKAAETVGVSGKSVDFASKVIKNGAPELVHAVEQGKIAVSTAAKLTALPQREQVRARQSAAGGDRKSVSANLRELGEPGKSTDQAAAVVGVSPRSIEHASRVIERGVHLKSASGSLSVWPSRLNSVSARASGLIWRAGNLA